MLFRNSGDCLRIGVDASCWANGRGYCRFAREVLRHPPTLAPAEEFVCFVDPLVEERLLEGVLLNALVGFATAPCVVGAVIDVTVCS